MSYYFEMTASDSYGQFQKRAAIELPDCCGTAELCEEFLMFLEACGHSRENALNYFEEEWYGLQQSD